MQHWGSLKTPHSVQKKMRSNMVVPIFYHREYYHELHFGFGKKHSSIFNLVYVVIVAYVPFLLSLKVHNMCSSKNLLDNPSISY
jgi:hypothetical protein